MKKITFIFLFLCSISFGQNLGNPAIIGQTNRNQKVGKGLQVTDTLITDGVVILKNLATFGSGVDTGVGFKNGKIVRFLNTGGGGSQTLSISNDTLSISNGNSVILPVYIQIDSSTINSYDVLNSQNAPPGSPSTGDVYLVGTVPTGVWVGHAKDIAEWNGSSWDFTDGVQGDFLYNATTALTYIFRSGNWVQTTGIPALNNGNTISSGLKIGTNNLKSLTFETNNKSVSRFDSIGRFYVYDTALRKSNKFLQIDSSTGRLIASAISANSGTSVLFPNGIKEVTESRDLQADDAGYILGFTSETIENPIFLNIPYPSPLAVGESFVLIGDNVNKVIALGDTSNLLQNEQLFFSTTSNVGTPYTFALSSLFLEGKTILKYLYDKSQNAIPLSGTEVGKPVTGDIETNNKLIFVTPEHGKKVTLSAQFDVEDDAEVLLPRSAGTIALQTDIPFISLENVLLAGNNSEKNINVNNGFFVNIIGGGGVVFYTNPDFSDASSIVPMANPYEGLLLGGNEDTSKGLTGKYDYSANITSLSYTQKIYVGFRGTATLSSGTVTVTTDKIKTGYKIYLSVNTPSGTQGFLSAPTGSIVDETEFVINSTSATDDSIVNWWIAP